MAGTYWGHDGRYQKQYHELWDKRVPASGEADTVHGEILRIVSRLYYDIFNNGGWNFDVYKDWRHWLYSQRDTLRDYGVSPRVLRQFVTKKLQTEQECDPVMDAAIRYAMACENGMEPVIQREPVEC